MFIGAHITTAGGLNKAIEKGQAIEAEALQIFPSAPVQWQIRGWSDEECAAFKEKWPSLYKEVIFHGIYLANLAATDGDNLKKSIKALIDTLNLASKLGIEKTVFHTGTYNKGHFERQDQVKAAIQSILAETPTETKLVFENTAGSTIGAKLEDLAKLIELSANPNRVGVCIDTCHAFASGYNFTNTEKYGEFKAQIQEFLGQDKVLAWHLNDSKFDLGEKRDRHENIGEGKIGLDPFRSIINDPDWQKISGYLEVPGFDDKGPDLKNLEILKNLKN